VQSRGRTAWLVRLPNKQAILTESRGFEILFNKNEIPAPGAQINEKEKKKGPHNLVIKSHRILLLTNADLLFKSFVDFSEDFPTG